MKRIAATVIALSFAFAGPVLAQGKNHEHGHDNGKAEGKEHGKAHIEQSMDGREQNGRERAKDNARVVTRQRNDNNRNERVIERQRADRRSEHRNDNYNYVTVARAKSGSPAFCRSGAGHPVYGRAWCVQKGFGLGNGNAAVWNRATWGDVVLQPRNTTVRDVLSSVILGRLTNYAAQTLGYRSPLAGSWVTNSNDRRVYLVRSGTAPVAEFVDVNNDGRADYVLLRH